jgi:hypothetical protein
MKFLITVLLLAALTFGQSFAQQTALMNAPSATSSASPFASDDAATPGALVASVPAPRLQTEPELSLDLKDWMLVGAAAPLRFFDYRSTAKATADPSRFREAELPQALVDNHAAFAAFEAGTVVANYYVYRLLVRHRHRSVARLGQAINLGALSWTVEHNYRLLSAH